MTIGTYEAKTRLSELIRMLDTEKEIVITNGGAPVAKLVPYNKPKERKIGLLKGKFKVTDKFDSMDDEIAELFGV